MNTKLRWFVIFVLFLAIIALVVVYVKIRLLEPQRGYESVKESWNGRTIEIPAPAQLPQWGKNPMGFHRGCPLGGESARDDGILSRT
jgi:hypothetical protein